jgi:hypothetical protein
VVENSEYLPYGATSAGVGPLLGTPDGSMLVDGERLGTSLGTRLGLLLGTSLGVVLGSTLGTVLGATESVGVLLGGLEFVGSELADGDELG